jgi:hypothetical protein
MAVFVSEASVYRLLKAHDLITSPAFIVMKAADEFKDKTTTPNQLWQTDFTYLEVREWRRSLNDLLDRCTVTWTGEGFAKIHAMADAERSYEARGLL